MMCDGGKMHVYDFEGKRYDMGDKFGAVVATVEYALRSPEYGDRLRAYLADMAANK